MAYDVLSKDLYESSDSPRSKKRKSHSEDDDEPTKKSGFNTIYLHIAIIVIIILGLFFYFSSDFTFNFKNEPKLTSLGLIGEVKTFNYTVNNRDLSLYSADFNLQAEDNLFSGTGTDFIINNFTGIILLKNETIVIEGVGQKLTYDKNVFQLKGKKFKLISNKKTTASIYFENITLDFVSGRIKLDESLNYEFENSSVILKGYNSTMSYDGTFSFLGHPNEFSLIAPQEHLNILYKE